MSYTQNNLHRGNNSFSQTNNSLNLGGLGSALSKSNVASAAINSSGNLLSSLIGGSFALASKQMEVSTAKQLPKINTEQYKERFLFHESKALNAGVPAALFHGINTPGRMQILGQGVSYGTQYNHIPVPHGGNALMLSMGQGYY